MICDFDELTFRNVTVDRYYHKEGIFEVKGRPMAALSFRVSGTGVFEVNGQRLTVAPGDVLFLPAYMPYRVQYSVSESIVIHLLHCNYTEAERIGLENSSAVHAAFGRLLEARKEGRSVNGVKSLVYELLQRIADDRAGTAIDTPVAACVAFLEERAYDPALDIPQVCAYGYLSVSTLQRAFQKRFGMSPKQYLLRLRMSRALELLAEGRYSVKEIAFRCGFTDEKYFSRAFRKKYGHPPSYFL